MSTASTSPSTRQPRVMTARARNEGGERATSFRAENRLRRVVAPPVNRSGRGDDNHSLSFANGDDDQADGGCDQAERRECKHPCRHQDSTSGQPFSLHAVFSHPNVENVRGTPHHVWTTDPLQQIVHSFQVVVCWAFDPSLSSSVLTHGTNGTTRVGGAFPRRASPAPPGIDGQRGSPFFFRAERGGSLMPRRPACPRLAPGPGATATNQAAHERLMVRESEGDGGGCPVAAPARTSRHRRTPPIPFSTRYPNRRQSNASQRWMGHRVVL
jgi:hypothetical protein